MRCLGPALLPVLLLSVCSAQDRLERTLAKMDDAARSFKALTANVKRVAYTAFVEETEVDDGTLVVKRPKPKDLRALFEIKGANARMMAYSGHTAEDYVPASNVVQIFDVDKKYGALANQYLLLGFGSSSRELQESYTIALGGPEAVAGQPATRLELIPRKTDTGMGLIKAELWISDQTGVALQQKFYERGGDYQMATYTNMKINPDIPDSAAELNLPKNVKKEYPQK
jgi:outer membrane lipoprotein-sorting protein